jgi:hypothetical protein
VSATLVRYGLLLLVVFGALALCPAARAGCDVTEPATEQFPHGEYKIERVNGAMLTEIGRAWSNGQGSEVWAFPLASGPVSFPSMLLTVDTWKITRVGNAGSLDEFKDRFCDTPEGALIREHQIVLPIFDTTKTEGGRPEPKREDGVRSTRLGWMGPQLDRGAFDIVVAGIVAGVVWSNGSDFGTGGTDHELWAIQPSALPSLATPVKIWKFVFRGFPKWTEAFFQSYALALFGNGVRFREHCITADDCVPDAETRLRTQRPAGRATTPPAPLTPCAPRPRRGFRWPWCCR